MFNPLHWMLAGAAIVTLALAHRQLTWEDRVNAALIGFVGGFAVMLLIALIVAAS